MLRFTPGGAVVSPTTLQIRVSRDYPGRVPAGAPEPGAGMTVGEVRANVDHFTIGVGPRGVPIDALVLAGRDLGAVEGLADVVRAGRRQGIRRVTVHLGRGGRRAFPGSALAAQTDAVALVVAASDDIADVRVLVGPERFVTAVVLLDGPGIEGAIAWCRALGTTGVDRVVLTWPLIGPPPAPATQAARVALEALDVLDSAGIPAGVKGLPACRLGSAERLWRSANRWYVDAAHQGDRALLFFGDVVRFMKGDACRFCPANHRCDGAPEAWVHRGLAGPFIPLGTE